MTLRDFRHLGGLFGFGVCYGTVMAGCVMNLFKMLMFFSGRWMEGFTVQAWAGWASVVDGWGRELSERSRMMGAYTHSGFLRKVITTSENKKLRLRDCSVQPGRGFDQLLISPLDCAAEM